MMRGKGETEPAVGGGHGGGEEALLPEITPALDGVLALTVVGRRAGGDARPRQLVDALDVGRLAIRDAHDLAGHAGRRRHAMRTRRLLDSAGARALEGAPA